MLARRKNSCKQDNGMTVLYNITLLVTMAGMFQTIGETLLSPVIKEIFSTVMHKNLDTIIKVYALSNNSIS